MFRTLPVVAFLLATAAAAAPPQSGIDTAGIATDVRPGDDFEEFANGGWRALAEIAPDRSSNSVFVMIQEIAERRLADLVKAAATRPGEQKIADFYRAWTDTAAIEARGLVPLGPELARYAAIPDKRALASILGGNLRADTDPINSTSLATENLFGVFVTQDLARPARSIPYLMQGGLGMADRDYYLSPSPDIAKVRDAYRAHVAKMLTLAAIPDAEDKAARIFDLETKIAAVHADIVASQDPHKAQLWRRADLARTAPGLDWDALLTAAGLGDVREFYTWQPAAITGIAALVDSVPLADWQAWLAFHRINTAASVLPKALDDAHFDFYGTTVSGTPAQRTREKRGIAATSQNLGDSVGKVYVADYFPASSRTQIEAMVTNILAAFDKRVAGLEWMAAATKAEARRKIATMKVGVGHGDKWRDDSSLEIRADDPLGNIDRARLHEYRHQLAKLGRPVDRGEWWMTPQTVNAVNLPLQNALNFPAALLEAPYFDPKADAAANYGAVGASIGHEIIHSFDNLGSEFDGNGALRNWWTAADKERFEAAGAALVRQYDGYEALPGLFLNGRQELIENIADVAGLTAAFEAWQASLKGKPAPVIDGKTGEQRFFIAFAQAWREKRREKSLRARITTDGHAPARWRAQTVRNLNAWYPAFDVKPGDKLHLPPEARVKVW